jgi:hypothetical protein
VADHLAGEGARIERARLRVRVELVDEVGEAEFVGTGVVERHEEVARRQQLADGLVDALEQFRQFVGMVRGLGDAVQRGLHARVAHVVGDVAEAVHAAGVDTVDDERLRAALDHAAVEEFDLRAGTVEGVAVDRVEALEGGLGMLQLRQQWYIEVSMPASTMSGDSRHISRKRPLQRNTLRSEVGDQDAVGGRLEGRRQLRELEAERVLRRGAVRRPVGLHQRVLPRTAGL